MVALRSHLLRSLDDQGALSCGAYEGDRAKGAGFGEIDDAFARALECRAQIIRGGDPRLVPLVHDLPRILLLTDGYCDPETGTVVAGLGAVILDVVGRPHGSCRVAEKYGQI